LMKKLLFIIIILFSIFFRDFESANVTCVINPSNSSCINYKLPSEEVENDIDGICSNMENMYGCSINKICLEDNDKTGIYCKRFSILKELCTDMTMKIYCNDYEQMCRNGTVVNECNTKVLPIPNSQSITNLIHSICSDMYMPGCEKCSGNGMAPCEVLIVYSQLCQSMPNMKQCLEWHSICSLVPNWSICYQNIPPPEMRMYFHTSIEDYVLFEQWVPRNYLEYIGTWVAIFLFAILFEFFRYLKNKLEEKWRNGSEIEEKKIFQ